MVCNGIGNKTYLTFLCHLFHNCCLSNPRRSNQQHRSLMNGSYFITSVFIFSCVDPYSIFNFFFLLRNGHLFSSFLFFCIFRPFLFQTLFQPTVGNFTESDMSAKRCLWFTSCQWGIPISLRPPLPLTFLFAIPLTTCRGGRILAIFVELRKFFYCCF